MTDHIRHKILVADDDEGIRLLMSELLKKEGLSFDIARDGEEAVVLLSSSDYSLVLLDEKMPRMNGLDVLSRMKAMGLRMPVIMITAHGSRELAMRAIEEGAYDFFTKPVDVDVVRTVIRRALEKYGLQQGLDSLRADIEEKTLVVAESPAMKKALSLARKVAETDVTVFISGESGSGKELLARVIHRLGRRRNGPFISVNCAAIPEGLLESELFGYEKGAFTGAFRQHTGKFELALGGTIFLDEIGDLTLNLQAKLLRALQDKEIERLGGKTPIKVDIRVISATNRDIQRLVSEGAFREDLLYRIRVFEIEMPPLRERRQDVPALCAMFLKKYSSDIGKDIRGISNDALKLLMAYRWPGNVREMENVIQRAIIVEEGRQLTKGTISGILEETVSAPSARQETLGAKEKMRIARDEEEKRLIEDALNQSKWKRQEAADILGISRKNLFLKMKKYGLM